MTSVAPKRSPGDVVVGSLGIARKMRPWLILWVDDSNDTCLLVGLTTQAHHVGTIRTTHPEYPYVGSFVSVMGTENTGRPDPVDHFNKQQREHVAAALRESIDL